MVASVALITVPLAVFIWALCRAGNDRHTRWDTTGPAFTQTQADRMAGRATVASPDAGNGRDAAATVERYAAPITLTEADRIVQAIRDLPETQVEEWLS